MIGMALDTLDLVGPGVQVPCRVLEELNACLGVGVLVVVQVVIVIVVAGGTTITITRSASVVVVGLFTPSIMTVL